MKNSTVLESLVISAPPNKDFKLLPGVNLSTITGYVTVQADLNSDVVNMHAMAVLYSQNDWRAILELETNVGLVKLLYPCSSMCIRVHCRVDCSSEVSQSLWIKIENKLGITTHQR